MFLLPSVPQIVLLPYNLDTVRYDSICIMVQYHLYTVWYGWYLLWYHTLSIRYDTDGIYIMVQYNIDMVWYGWYLYNGTIHSRYGMIRMVSILWYHAISIRYDTDGIYITVRCDLDTVRWYLYYYQRLLYLDIITTYWLKTRSDFFVTLQLTQERCHYL